MAVTAETLRLAGRLRKQTAKIVDAQARALTAAWVDALDEVSTDLREATLDLVTAAKGGTVTRSQALKSTRLRKALAAIADSLDAAAKAAGVTISTDLPEIVRQAGEAQQAIIASQLPAAERGIVQAWSRVDPASIEAIVTRSTEQITVKAWELSADAYQSVRKELIRGVSIGDNPRKTAAEMVKRTTGAFNGGLSRALNISRTEVHDAHRAANQLSRGQNADTLAGWLCTLSARTCPTCLGKNGELHPAGDAGPLGHHSCRCTAVPVARTWRDLGIDMDEPADVFPDARAWFGEQTEATQLQIMGPQRLELLTSGKVSWEDLSQKRSTPGWRDAWHMTSVRDLAARAA